MSRTRIPSLDRWTKGERVTSDKLNAQRDAVQSLALAGGSDRQHRGRPNFRWRYGVVRAIAEPEGSTIQFSFIRMNELFQWIIPREDDVEYAACEPNVYARHYGGFLHDFASEDFPVHVTDDIRPLPIVPLADIPSASGLTWLVLHHSPLYYPPGLPSGLYHTDCYLQDGQGGINWGEAP